MAEKKNQLDVAVPGNGPFTTRVNASKQVGFDQYYYDISEKEVFKGTGQKDENGDELGVIETKFIVKKIDINDLLESQRDSVGVESYVRALSLQGETIDDYNTVVSDKVNDFSNMPDTLAEVLTAGDRAKAAFDGMDSELKGGHTTIEGFLNSLSKEVIDKYIAGKLEALNPAKKEGE